MIEKLKDEAVISPKVYMSYFDFVNLLRKENVKVIFELGSRDAIDAIKLANWFDCVVYAFECNPDCLVECKKQLTNVDHKNVVLVEKAVSLVEGDVTFYPFDISKYDNMGASSLLKIDFSMRDPTDPDYNMANPQTQITVPGTRLDTFIADHHITGVDLLCIDLQGYELNALKSLGEHLHNVKYIITECSVQSTYTDGATFNDVATYLADYHFTYVCSNRFGYHTPDPNVTGYSEFDALFVHTSMSDDR
jgi:FkbM family methyltransferase